MSRVRIGIFGGTFDPIHKGHLEAARAVLEAAALDQVLFMPTGDPPHKTDRQVTPAPLRYEMVCAAVKEANVPRFGVSDMEIQRSGYTYTVDTLRALQDQWSPDNEYVWIIGADVLADLTHWKDYEQVFEMCSFVAMHRPGYSPEDFRREYQELSRIGARIQFVEVPPVDLSSTEIRQRCLEGQDIRNGVPVAVADIIEKCGLYQESDRLWTISQIQADLELRLSPRRYAHSLRVMEESARIAKVVGADEGRCALAGLLHDAAREFTPSQFLWLGLNITSKVVNGPYRGMEEILLHGEASALLAMRRYGVQDEDVLQAISCHTTGKSGMGVVAQIVFVADFTEPGRVGPHFDKARRILSEQGLMAAVLAECTMTIEHRLDEGKSICIDTVETRNWALSEIE